MMNAITMKRFCSVAVVLGLTCLSASADLLLIDFGPAGAGSYTNFDGTHYWNNIGGNETIANLRTTNNSLSGIHFSVSGASGVNTWNAGLAPDANLNNGLFAFETVTRDGLYNNAGVTATVALSNLNASLTYNLTFFGSRQDFTRYTTYTIGATSVELQTGAAPDVFNSNQVVSITGLVPSGSGVITMTFTGNNAPGGGGTADFSYLNALGIEVVPEPGSLALLLLGSGALWLARRKSAA